MIQPKIRMAAIRPTSAIQAKRSLEFMGGSGLSGEMHGENLPVQGRQEPAGRTHFAVAGGDGFDVVAFGGEVAARIADGGRVIRIPVGKRGVVAYLCAVDEQEGVILAEGIVGTL